MKRKAVLGIMLTLLLIGILTLAFDIQSIKAETTILEMPAITPEPKLVHTQPPWTMWTRYHNYSEIVETLLYLNSTYPNIVDVFSIGKSWENRNIYCIKLTNEGLADPKPKVFFVGCHHANELISAELPLYFVVHAVTGYGVNSTITRMLDFSEIYVVVALNVDGFDAVEVNELQRKNVHPFDEDGDSLLDEDPPDDEDGDGFIEVGTGGLMEGIDDDGDGLLNEDWIGGVDINRNYGYHWGEPGTSGSPDPSSQAYWGPTPFSEPETQAIRDWLTLHSFKYAASFHSGVEGIGYPWCYTDTPPPDDELLREIAGNLSYLVNAPFTQGGAWQKNSGTWLDWMYGNRSTIAVTCEIFVNESAIQVEGEWTKGFFQLYNPEPAQIETVILRWLPVFTYITNRTISEAYDLAVTNITLSKTIVEQGYNLGINVTVANEGDFTETFNVTAYANTNIIATFTNVTLTSGNSTNVIFTWNTTDVPYGNYAISAYAHPVPGEAYTSDNIFVDHVVEVVPEFPAFLILPLFMIATLLAVIVYRRKRTTTS